MSPDKLRGRLMLCRNEALKADAATILIQICGTQEFGQRRKPLKQEALARPLWPGRVRAGLERYEYSKTMLYSDVIYRSTDDTSHKVALPVCRLVLPFFHLQNPMPPTMALTNQSSMLMRSIHTAFFILEMPPSPRGSRLMYKAPKRPNTATQSMKRTKSQAKRIAVVKVLMIKGRIA